MDGLIKQPREVIGHFFKDASKRVWLCSLTVVAGHSRKEFDVDYSRTLGCYLFHCSGAGGSDGPI